MFKVVTEKLQGSGVWGIAVAIVFVTVLFGSPVLAQDSPGALYGRVSDELGGVIVGAFLTIEDAGGTRRASATTNTNGIYEFTGLAPGNYFLRAEAQGFATHRNPAVEISARRRRRLNIKLSVTLTRVRMTVIDDDLNTEPEKNASAVVLRGELLDALPDDPDSYTDALRALAGPAAGPTSGEILVDGFTRAKVPPKSSIREVRINQNPFSAEHDRPGYGRVVVFTKPGTNRFRGQSFFSFNDGSLNSRNPFAPNRAPFQARSYGGNVSGPVVARRASFFADFERREMDDNAVINATILDSALKITPYSLAVLTPQRRMTLSPRFDLQINPNHTLVARYIYARTSAVNAGVGDFSLASRAYATANTNNTLQLTETAVIGAQVVNETRFQYAVERRWQVGDNSLPTIRVLDAFTGGGAQVGLSLNDQQRWELQNHTIYAAGRHLLRVGARVRGVNLVDLSPQNFGGTYTFAGGLAPQLDAANQILRDVGGNVIRTPITSLERYRRTLLFQQLGFSPAAVRTLGGGATQFSIAGGNPEARVRQRDYALFGQDDWQLRPYLTLSLGLRYETQTNISSNSNFAPRLAFAWSPGTNRAAASAGSRPAATVIRGGIGIFYDRFNENYTLQVKRFNGINQQQFVVSDPNILDLFPQVPSIAALTAFAVPPTTRRIAGDLQTPYSIYTSIGVERRLPLKLVLATTLVNARTLHVLRSRNINAPLPGTFLPNVRGSGVRPFGDVGNVFQYESSGRLDQNQLTVNVNNGFNRRVMLFATYVLNKANSDTDGANTFPADSYNLVHERGRSLIDIRHHFTLGGTVRAPWGIALNPFIVASSGRPFNITTGRDTNGDTLFTERPAFATDLTRPSVVVTRFGAFDTDPDPAQKLIPRNYADGPGFFLVNLGLSKTFRFSNPFTGGGGGAAAAPQNGGRGKGGGAKAEKRYGLTFSLQVQNLLNHTNGGTPIGNLRSTTFGRSNSVAGGYGFGDRPSAGNRRIEAQIRLSF